MITSDKSYRKLNKFRNMEENERKYRWKLNSTFLLKWLLILGFNKLIYADNLLQAPRFTTFTSNSIIRLGTTKIVQCQAFGNPPPQFKWLKNDHPITEFSTDPFYKIISARLEDGGSYRCIASNKIGSILSEEIKIIVAYMDIFKDQDDDNKILSVTEGDAAIIKLPEIDSVPAPDVTWQSDEGSLLYAQKYVQSKTNDLIILSTEKSDQKPYRARAINSQEGKEENSAYIQLNIEDSLDQNEIAPRIIIAPEDLQIIKGNEEVARLDCIANARPLYELETLWFKDGIPVDSAGISSNFNDPWNRSLTLLSINTSYSGMYECNVNLRSGGFPTVKAVAQVVVLEKPRFLSNAKPETLVDYGSQLNLPCDVIGIPKPNVTWYRNSEELNLNDKRYVQEEDNSLLIKKVVVTDDAMYQCFARNKAGESSLSTWVRGKKKRDIRSIAAELRRLRTLGIGERHGKKNYIFSTSTTQPIIELGPKNLTVLDGKDATLSCRAIGAPNPNITWIFNNGSSEEAEDEQIVTSSRIQILETGDLLIAAVKEQDAGKYTCIRTNEAGQVKESAYLTVLVRTQIIQPPVDTRVLLGFTATLQCKVSADSAVPFELQWYRDKILIKPRGNSRISVLTDGTLEINSVRASDVGFYTCSVRSTGGNETRSAKLSVIELPFAPTNVKAERIDEEDEQRAVNVSWIPGFDGNSPIIKYIVQKREVPEFGPIPDPLLNWITELSNVSGDQRWILLTNLKAAASYQFRVSAVNSVGEGGHSAPSNQIMLPQEAPSGPPVGFVGSARSSSEIITQWQPPLEEHRNGLILGYIIRYRLYGYNESPWTIRNITNEAQRNYLITDLITWKDYIVQIAAYNNKGIGIFTEGAKIKTREGVPEAPPIIQKLEALNSTTIQIWWIPPDPQKINGINQGYKIQAWKWFPNNRGHVETDMITVHPNLLDPYVQQTAFMNNLEKFTEYNITVLCFTDPGDGQISDFVYIKTKEDVPDEVSSLQFDDISDRAVKVLWQPPKKINGILTGYQIQYQIKDLPETLRIRNLSSETFSEKITDLQATTHYKFEVTAWTAVGSGPPKIAIIQSGVEPVLPHTPSKLALSNIEAFSVVLQFTPGFDGNSSISKWTVQAQTARNNTWFTVYEIIDADATTITVTGLVPFTMYRLRLIANNVVGASPPSEPTKEFQTIQATPAHPPKNVTVRAMSATELRVRWIPLQQIEWFGNPRGYNITYNELRTGYILSASIEDPTANSHVIIGLEEYALYEIRMQACNDVGCSAAGPKAVERTRESVPSFGPMSVVANASSSTTILVKWGEVPKEHQNGLIEGFKVYYATDPTNSFYQIIKNNNTFTTTLTKLKKYTVYHIQVLAYTRLGDGAASKPAVSVRTFDDVPGIPSNVSFPDVSLTSARIIWDVPEEPNGEIIAYRVTCNLIDTTNNRSSKEFQPSDRTFRFTNLEPDKYYRFSVTAQTHVGWGRTADALVFTTNNRELPQPPSMPQISRSQIQSSTITFNWTPGRDGYAPLRYYIVQKMEGNNPWQSLSERVDPQLNSYTVENLKPFTTYKFRIQAVNDIGPSRFSAESIQVRTYPAAPIKAVTAVKAVPITTSSVEVFWYPIDEQYWSGDTESGGYRVDYQIASDFPTALNNPPNEAVKGINANKMVLSGLQEDKNYEIFVVPFNNEGDGPKSTPITIYVGEAVPTGKPQSLHGNAVSSTEVHLEWKPPQHDMQNGDLLGYKIFYLVIESPQKLEEGKRWEEEIEVVPASTTSHNLVFLDKFTKYKIQILAFNPAGDGPRSVPIFVMTHPGLPNAPVNLKFTEITMNSLIVMWDVPSKPNGNISGYIVAYETAQENEKFSKQVKQKVTTNFLQIQNLEEEVMYTFTVRAQTIDYGPSISNNVTTGPQGGSPGSPKELIVTRQLAGVDLHWINGPTGKGPIIGYYFESQRKDDTRWLTVTKTNNGPLQDFSISYQSLLPSTAYIFRVIPFNKFGISCPALSDKFILTPSKLYMEYGYLQNSQFYRQTWFMVALAAVSIIIIITIIAILCVKSKSYKYKQEAQKTLEESMAMSMGDHQELSMDYYRSNKSVNGTITAMGTLSKRNGQRKSPHNQPPPILGKSPPRPSPASVPYNSDEESLKGYDENPDDSSVTEKPSEISSSEQGSESENESVRSDPHSFVNHYANVNDTLRQSWKRQKPVKNNYSSYTDSEPEGSATTGLNGGQVVLNNMARSRAPLPGFSSFV